MHNMLPYVIAQQPLLGGAVQKALVGTYSSRIFTGTTLTPDASEDWSITFKINPNDGSSQGIMGTTSGYRTKVYYFPGSTTIRIENSVRGFWDIGGISEGVWYKVEKTNGLITIYENDLFLTSDSNAGWNVNNVGGEWALFAIDGYDITNATISNFYVQGKIDFEAVATGDYGTGAGSPSTENTFWDKVNLEYKAVIGSAFNIEVI